MTNERMRESLSALMDGEASELETRRLLRDLDNETAASLGRWQLARDVLQGHQVAMPGHEDFSGRVSAALGKQEAARPGWINPIARVAVAASVAAATVTGWHLFQSAPAAGPVTAAHEAQGPSLLGPAGELAVRELRGVEARAAAVSPLEQEAREEHLEDLILRHGEFTTRHGGQGAMASARVMGREAGEEAR